MSVNLLFYHHLVNVGERFGAWAVSSRRRWVSTSGVGLEISAGDRQSAGITLAHRKGQSRIIREVS